MFGKTVNNKGSRCTIFCSILLITEGCLNSNEYEGANETFKCFFGENYIQTFLLHKYSNAVHLHGEIYGSLDSIHSSSALVYARPSSNMIGDVPGFVMRYIYTCECVAKR